MATVRFLNRSTKNLAPLTMRFEHNRKQYDAPTKIMVEQDFKTYYNKTVRSPELRNKQSLLEEQINPLEKHVLKTFYNLEDETVLSQEWLRDVYANYSNPDKVDGEKLNITYWFDHRIENHKKIKNAKGTMGLEPNTLKGYRNTKETVFIYESEILKRKLKLSDMTQAAFDRIKDFLFDFDYKPTTIHKTLSIIKLMGKHARKQQMKLPDNFEVIEIERAKTKEADEDVIYLTNEELKRIIALDLKQDYLDNARKWLLLGAYTGQRIGDQLSKFTKDNIHTIGDDLEIRLTQSKTGTQVTIPVHPYIRVILNPENMPRVISQQRLNDYIKKVCELAEINEPIDDKKLEFVKEIVLSTGKKKKLHRKVKKVRPKYKYVSSHIGRRTFCMMWLKKLHIQDIMAVSGHTTEKSFLTYINKKNDNHVQAFKDKFAEINKKA